jgi:hypothetical protein
MAVPVSTAPAEEITICCTDCGCHQHVSLVAVLPHTVPGDPAGEPECGLLCPGCCYQRVAARGSGGFATAMQMNTTRSTRAA